jgi:serine/threonine protein kinase
MGEVYKAVAQGFDRIERVVAIKLIRTSLASEPDLVKMFVEEAKLAFVLNHANLVQTFDVGTIDGQYFIAMEFVEGRTLSHLLRACRNALGQLLPHRHAVYIAAETCKGLHYAHRAKDAQGRALGIVHRDVSPSNILVSRDGEVKVSDFGIAWSTMKSHKSELGAIKGKVPYMPPEQVRGAALDARADVYALGAVLYEAVCGRPPFVGPAGALIPLVIEGKYARPRDVSPEVPEDLEAIILHAMAHRPEDRFESAAAMRDELEELAMRRAWRLSSTDLSSFAEALDAVPIERTPEADAFDLALGQELCKVANADGELSVFTSALAAGAPAGEVTESTTPDVPERVVVPVDPGRPPSPEVQRPSVPGDAARSPKGGSMRRPSIPPPTRASVPPSPATGAPAPSADELSVDVSAHSEDGRPPRRRARLVALYVVAIVVVAVGAGLAARSGPRGVETLAGTTLATAPAPASAPPSAYGEVPGPLPAAPANQAAPGPVVATPVALPVGVAPPGGEPPGSPARGPSIDGGVGADPAEPPAGVEPAMAVLAINTEPWTRVEIDGASAGTTPVIGRRVRPGRHTVRLTNPGRGITRTLSVTLRAGERRRIVLDLSGE